MNMALLWHETCSKVAFRVVGCDTVKMVIDAIIQTSSFYPSSHIVVNYHALCFFSSFRGV